MRIIKSLLFVVVMVASTIYPYATTVKNLTDYFLEVKVDTFGLFGGTTKVGPQGGREQFPDNENWVGTAGDRTTGITITPYAVLDRETGERVPTPNIQSFSPDEIRGGWNELIVYVSPQGRLVAEHKDQFSPMKEKKARRRLQVHR